MSNTASPSAIADCDGEDFVFNKDGGLTKMVITIVLVLLAILCIIILAVAGLIISLIYAPRITILASLALCSAIWLIRDCSIYHKQAKEIFKPKTRKG